MLLEALVIGMCLGKYECAKTPQAYYLSKPKLRSWVKEKTDTMKDSLKTRPVAQVVVPTLLGSAFLMTGGKPRIRVTDNASLTLSQRQLDITFTYVF
jgi:hypothetical protein